MSGKHLVIVAAADYRGGDTDWIYNAADIDSAKVIWARDMGWDANRELVRYYGDRRIWIIRSDASVVLLYPYPREEQFATLPPPV
jgi:hypothetical protein